MAIMSNSETADNKEKDTKKHSTNIDERRLKSLVKFNRYKPASIKELLDLALIEIVALSQSELGFICNYNEETRQLILHAWSENVMKNCRINESTIATQLDETGFWGEAVRQRKPVINNEFHAPHPLKKGYPEGHADLYRFMSIPVFVDKKIVAVAGVANKGEDYTPEDAAQLTLMMESILEIVERKKAEEALRQSEERYRAIFEQAAVGICHNTLEGQFIKANRAFMDMLGYSNEELTRMNYRDITYAKDLELDEKKTASLLKGEISTFSLEKRYLRKDGEVIWVYLTVSKTQTTQQTPSYLVAVVENINDRKRFENELEITQANLEEMVAQRTMDLQASEERYRVLFENQHTVMIIVDPEDGNIVEANPAAVQFYGYSRDDFLKMNISDLNILPPAEIKGEMELAKTQKKPYFQFKHRLANGLIRYVEVYSGPIEFEGRQLLFSVIHDNTDRFEAQAALSASEERYRTLFEEAVEGILQTTPSGEYISSNLSFAKMSGFASIEEMAKTVKDIRAQLYANPDDRDRLLNALAEHGKVENFEFEWKRKDGTKIWISINSKAIRNEKDELVRLDSRIVDITSRKQTELELKQKTEELDRFFNVALDLLCIADQQGRFKMLNKAWETTLGYPLSELIGKKHIEFVHPDDLETTRDAMTKLATQNPVINFINRIRCRDGSYRWIEWHSAPAGDLVYAAARDITERKQVEDDLFNSQKMLQLVLDTIPQRVFWKDADLIYLGCNRALAQDAGLRSTKEIIGKTDSDLSWKENADQYRQDDQWVMDSNKAKLNYEEPRKQSNGRNLWLRTNKVPLHDRKGKVIGILGTYDDITERRDAEQQLKEANEKLTSLVKNLEQRNHEAQLLRQMDDLLQVCNTSDEAYIVLTQFGPQLFPGTSGALFIMGNSRVTVEAVAIWGKDLASERIFKPDDCWTLRLAKFHEYKRTIPGLRCAHIPDSFNGDYFAVPMLAASELLGLLHIESTTDNLHEEKKEEKAQTVSEHLALALSNIRLREKLHSQSIRDPLTGLFNRRYMEESLEREIHRANRSNNSIGIIMLDIDHFKQVNDSYGHEAGDAILHNLGCLLLSQVRAGDIACRFGGEEFIIILPDASAETTRQRAEEIRQAVEKIKVDHEGEVLNQITVSLGTAAFPKNSASIDGIIHQADKALYQAKHNGRNRVESADHIK